MPLIEVLLARGMSPDAITLVGKPYSTIPEAAAGLQALGVTVIAPGPPAHPAQYDRHVDAVLAQALDAWLTDSRGRRRIVFDDGGRVAETLALRAPDCVTSVSLVQQTRSGWYNPHASKFPNSVDVAFSAAKRHYESEVIAASVTQAVLARSEGPFVVNGMGAVGSRVFRALRAQGADVLGRDLRADRAIQPRHFRSHPTIIGCVGLDWMSPRLTEGLERPVTLISASSRAVEFGAILSASEAQGDTFGDFVCPAGRHRILNGGYPINFDRLRERETLLEISLTRALSAAAIVLADGGAGARRKLPPTLQAHAVERWHALLGRPYQARPAGWWGRCSRMPRVAG